MEGLGGDGAERETLSKPHTWTPYLLHTSVHMRQLPRDATFQVPYQLRDGVQRIQQGMRTSCQHTKKALRRMFKLKIMALMIKTSCLGQNRPCTPLE